MLKMFLLPVLMRKGAGGASRVDCCELYCRALDNLVHLWSCSGTAEAKLKASFSRVPFEASEL